MRHILNAQNSLNIFLCAFTYNTNPIIWLILNMHVVPYLYFFGINDRYKLTLMYKISYACCNIVPSLMHEVSAKFDHNSTQFWSYHNIITSTNYNLECVQYHTIRVYGITMYILGIKGACDLMKQCWYLLFVMYVIIILYLQSHFNFFPKTYNTSNIYQFSVSITLRCPLPIPIPRQIYVHYVYGVNDNCKKKYSGVSFCPGETFAFRWNVKQKL